MNIVNVGYNSTNYYLIDLAGGKLLIDAGWPGTINKFKNVLTIKGIPLADIKYLLVTHYHPDHAGLVQELKENGIKLIVLEQQINHIPLLKDYIKRGFDYKEKEIQPQDNLILKTEDSRRFLKTIGIDGEIIHTPGHSDDSVTLVLDSGIAFTGDLPDKRIYGDSNSEISESWNKIYGLGVHTIRPGH